MADLTVTAEQLLSHRLRANNLAERLPAGELAAAAFAGLQDSAPRAALTSLHARVQNVGANDWADPSLVQTWAPRGAIFVVPEADLAVFTLGILPRDPELRGALEELGSRARELLRESPGGAAEPGDRLGEIPAPLAAHLKHHPIERLAFAIAGVRLRWDARWTEVRDGPAPEGDAEEARLELVRRYLRSLGPASPEQFTRWAAVGADDAQASFDAIRDELIEVDCDGQSGLLLAADAQRLSSAAPVSGIRLLAFGGDPVLQPGDERVMSDHRRDRLPRWACAGLALHDGEPVASWGRSGQRMTLTALADLDHAVRVALEEEARAVPNPQPIREALWRGSR